jgi:hypothetical protein
LENDRVVSTIAKKNALTIKSLILILETMLVTTQGLITMKVTDLKSINNDNDLE